MREVGPRVTGPTGDGRAEPWCQEGGLTGIGEVGGQGTQSPGVRKADGDTRGRGTGRTEPWSQEGGLTGIGEGGGQAGVVGGYSGPREPGTPSTVGKNNQQSRVA